MADPKELDLYTHMLYGPWETVLARDTLLIQTLQKGVLVSLGEAGSADAINLLYEFISRKPDPALDRLGMQILEALAVQGNADSKNAVCRLFIACNHSAARQAALDHRLIPDEPSEKALFFFLTGQMEAFQEADPGFQLLADAYLSGSVELKKRLLGSARQAGLDELVLVLTALQNPTPEGLAVIVQNYSHLKSEKIKELAIGGLADLAERESQPGKDALCQLFIATENTRCLAIAQEKGYLPSDPANRALFYLLSSQMEKYEQLDFNRSLLASIYGSIDKPIRNRIMLQVQKNGHPDWIKGITGNSRIRFVNDLTDADWESAILSLKEKGDSANLWKLAQVSPPFWSAQILKWLYENRPSFSEEGALAFSHLTDLARDCIGQPPVVDPIKTLSGHLMEVTCLSSDAARDILVSGSADQSIRVWDFDSGDLLNLVSYPGRQIRSLAVSPDGKQVAVSTDDHAIQVINLADNRFVKSFQGHTSTVKSIAITPDGWFLASGSFDRTIKLWRFPFGPELKTISGTTSEVFCLAVSTDRRYLFSAGADRMVRVWSLPEGAPHRVLEGHSDTVTFVAASPDGQYLASSSRDNTIRIWNFPGGSIHKDLPPQTSLPTCLAFTPDSHLLLSGHLDGTIGFWNISSGLPVLSLPAHQGPVTGLVLNRDGMVLASSSNDRQIKLWDIRSIVLTRLPIDEYTYPAVRQIQEWSKDRRVSASNRSWLQFALELYQQRRRFDIEIGEPKVIEAGQFDIEL
jgi:WD40 repeat protein